MKSKAELLNELAEIFRNNPDITEDDIRTIWYETLEAYNKSKSI